MKKRWIKIAVLLVIAAFGVNMEVLAEELQMQEVQQTQFSVETVSKKEGRWVLDGNGWWYAWSDGTWPSNEIVEISGVKYAFYPSGYMAVGWYQDETGWYFFDGNGAMRTGWLYDRGVWYYLDAGDTECPGRMVENCERMVNGARYFFSSSGAMRSGWILCSEGWYYVDVNGAFLSGWLLDRGTWYYLDGGNSQYPGLMLEDTWLKSVGGEYYLTQSGAMAVNWLLLPEGWYYLGSDGAKKTGWQLIGETWYYFYTENDPNDGMPGLMATNTEIDEWVITESGAAYCKLDKKIEEIKKYITTPYVYGGSTPDGWDCSGFTQWALNYLGVSIPRSSWDQATGGVGIDVNNRDTWRPGDVLVYQSGNSYTHVALYLGDGMLMHALNSRVGTVIQSVDYYEKYDQSNFLALVRRYL